MSEDPFNIVGARRGTPAQGAARNAQTLVAQLLDKGFAPISRSEGGAALYEQAAAELQGARCESCGGAPLALQALYTKRRYAQRSPLPVSTVLSCPRCAHAQFPRHASEAQLLAIVEQWSRER